MRGWWFLVVVACSEAKKPPATPEQVAAQELDALVASLTSIDRRARESAIVGVNTRCCSHDPLYPERESVRTRACDELRRIVETERDDELLVRALGVPTPLCGGVIPSKRLVEICDEPCSHDLRYRVDLWFAMVEPSPELAKSLLASIDPPPEHEDLVKYTLRMTHAFRFFGEDDLAPVIAAAESPDLFTRALGVSALGQAFSDPIDAPDALRVVEKVKGDAHPVLASYAEAAADSYRSATKEPADVLVARWSESPISERHIRLLGVRRFFCKSAAAGQLLERLATGPDRVQAMAAKQALALRNARCR